MGESSPQLGRFVWRLRVWALLCLFAQVFKYKFRVTLMHTDQYKVNLRSLPEGDHEYRWLLDDAYFERLSEGSMQGGEVEVDLMLRRTGDVFSLSFDYEGYVTVPCDRCLDPVEIDVVSDREFVVKFGVEALEESDEILVVSELDGVLDLEWILYEDIVLSLPIQRVHDAGECNPDMMSAYDRVATDQVREPSEGGAPTLDEDGIDERWAALKGLK